MTSNPRFVPCGDRALLIYLGTGIDPGTNRLVHGLARTLRAQPHPAVVEVTPAYHCLMVEYDPLRLRSEQLEELILSALADARSLQEQEAALELPVLYGGEAGPDLDTVAAHTGLPADEVVQRHSAAVYRVYCLGFSPGFPYLGGLDPALATPRLAEPRTKVPAGSVAIGGKQTGVYPVTSPGGWQVIGRTPVRLFDPHRQSPALLEPGGSIRFVPITPDQFAAIEARAEVPERSMAMFAEGKTGIRILQPGMFTTVQDLGRRGYVRYGVPVAGAADFWSLMVGNWLLGNRARTAALEVTLLGPEVEFTGPIAFCVTGAPVKAELTPAGGGSPRPVPGWTAMLAGPGDRLRMGTAETGCRSYLCVAGGIDLPPVLGSLSEDLFGKLGPLGRPLRAGDWLPTGLPLHPPADLAGRSLPWDAIPAFGGTAVIRAVRGPQAGAFPEASFGTFFGAEYTVGAASDRQGLRLQGPEVHLSGAADILSEPVPPGSIQVPANRQPILLLGNRQTMGGYAKPAIAVYPDVAVAGQLRPGDKLKFQEVDFAQAHGIAWSERRRLAQIRRHLEREMENRGDAPLPIPQYPDQETVQITLTEPTAPPVSAPEALPEAPPLPSRVRSFRITMSGITFEATVEEVED